MEPVKNTHDYEQRLSDIEKQLVELVGKGKNFKFSEPSVLYVDEFVAKDYLDSVSVKENGIIELLGRRIDEAGLSASFSLKGRDEYDLSDLDKALDAIKWDLPKHQEIERRLSAVLLRANELGLEYHPVELKESVSVDVFNFDMDEHGEMRSFDFATVEKDNIFLYENLYDVFESNNGHSFGDLPDAIQQEVVNRLFDSFFANNDQMTVVYDKQVIPSYALLAIVNGDFSSIDNPEDEKAIRDFMDKNPDYIYDIEPDSEGFSQNPAFGLPTDCVTVFMLKSVTPEDLLEQKKNISPKESESEESIKSREDLSDSIWKKLDELLPENGNTLLLHQPFTISKADSLKNGVEIDVFNIRRSINPDYESSVFVCGNNGSGINTFRLTHEDLLKIDEILNNKQYVLQQDPVEHELREARGYLMDVISHALAQMNGHVEIVHTELPSVPMKGDFWKEESGNVFMELIKGEHNVKDAMFHDVHAEKYTLDEVINKLNYSETYALTIAIREAQIKDIVSSFDGQEIYFDEPVAISRDDDDIEKDYVAGVKIDDDGSLNISGHRVDDNGETHVFYHAEDLCLNGYDDLLAKLSEMRQQENVKQEHFLEPFTDEQWKVMSEIGYPYAPGNAKENEAAPIPDMVYWRVAAGMLTKDDAIRVFDATGYTVGSNPERTIEILSSLNAQYGKLDNNLSPVSVQSIPSEGTVEEAVSKEITLYRLGGGFIALGSDASFLADKSSGTVNDYSIEDSGDKGEFCFLNRKDFSSLLESGVDLNIRIAGKNVPLETSKVLYYLSTRLVDKQDDTVKKSTEKNDFLNHVLYGNRRSAIGYNLENRINTFMKDNGVDIPWSDLFFETKISRWSDLHQVASRAVESILRESGQGDESLLNSTTAEYVSEKAKSVALDIVSSVHEDEVNFDIHRKEALDAIGYPYSKNTTKPDGSLNLPTTDESLYWEYAAGVISLKDAAREFCRTGWTNFVDDRFTKMQFAALNEKLGKLDTDLNPLIMSKSSPADSLKNMLDNHFQMREDIGKRIYFTHPIPFENEAGSWRAIDVHCGVKNYEIEDNEGNKIPYDVFGHYEQIAAAVKESANAPLEHQDFSFRIGRNDYNIVVSSVDGRDRFVAMISLSGDKNVLAGPTMLDADISRLFIDIKDSSDSAVRANFGEAVANRHFGDLSRSIRQQEEIVAGYREAGLLGKPIDLVEPIVYEKQMSDNVAEVNDSSHYLSIELYENLENAKENIDPTFFMDKGSKDYRQTMYDSLKETLNVHLEQSAKHAIHDRIINSWQRTFTPNQIDALNRYHQIAVSEVSAKETFSRLLHEVSQEPDVARKPEKWIADTARELDDIAKGQVRDEMQQLKR